MVDFAALQTTNARPLTLPRQALIVPPLAVLGVLFLYPLALIARQALYGAGDAMTLDHVATVVRTSLFQAALWHTIEIAVASSALCLLLGFVIALVLAFVPFPARARSAASSTPSSRSRPF